MTKKKKSSSDQIVTAYMKYILTEGERPKSVFLFVQDHGLTEAEFYAMFGSFEGLERNIFTQFYTKVMDMLNKDKDFESYGARDKLLSFYFTFFEMLTANRSFVKAILSDRGMMLAKAPELQELRKQFTEFVSGLDIAKMNFKEERMEQFKNRGVKEAAWGQMIYFLEFWLNDSSVGFEKTDLLIEKSLKATFDVIDTSPLKSVMDLGKFIFKEKTNPR